MNTQCNFYQNYLWTIHKITIFNSGTEAKLYIDYI